MIHDLFLLLLYFINNCILYDSFHVLSCVCAQTHIGFIHNLPTLYVHVEVQSLVILYILLII